MAPAAAFPRVLRAAIGTSPRTAALKDGAVASDLLVLDFDELPNINRAFAPMVRELRYDVCEMAIATFLQAKASGKHLVMLPVVLAARFQEAAMLCESDSSIRGPGDLAGRRIGVRAYGQTTAMWLRGILQDEWGIQPDQVRWVTFEGAHLAEAADPPCAERAPHGADMLAMLHARALDAVIVGNDVPNDPRLRTVFPDPAQSADAFWRRHGLVPVNHMLTVRGDLAERSPQLVAELVRMFRASAASVPAAARDAYPCGRDRLDPAVSLALRYATRQGLLQRPLDLAQAWGGLPETAARATEEETP